MTVDTRLAVLKVLAGQGKEYAIFPNAAAFHAEGLPPFQVAEILDELHREGRVERELLDGDTLGGYRLTTTNQGG